MTPAPLGNPKPPLVTPNPPLTPRPRPRRGMMDEEGNQFVAYFLPVEETLRKRKRDQEEDVDYAPEDV